MPKELWICNVCDLPCEIVIHYSNQKLPVHLHGEDKFVDKHVCLCREARPHWEENVPKTPAGHNSILVAGAVITPGDE